MVRPIFQRLGMALVIALVLPLTIGSVLLADEEEWGYEGERGPVFWGDLSPEYAVCSAGLEQSPIALMSSSPRIERGLQIDYQPSDLTVVNNGHTIQVNYDGGSSLRVDGQDYELLQFHFHNPSEHVVDGEAPPMEMHLVHRNDQDRLAVLGIFLVEGAENAALAPVFANLPRSAGEPQVVEGERVDAAGLLPAGPDYWRYDGSLTTPPCSEGVSWFVFAEPVEVSAGQIAAYTVLYAGNARPLQPLNARTVGGDSVPDTLPATGASGAPISRFFTAGAFALFLLSGALLSARRRRRVEPESSTRRPGRFA